MEEQSIEMQSMSSGEPICSICYKEEKGNLFECKRCKEGNVCDECILKLQELNQNDKCPICQKTTNDNNTWYKDNDIELGNANQDNEPENGQEDNEPELNRLQRLILMKCTTNDIVLFSFLSLFTIWIAFIVGTLFKLLIKQCAWRCKDEDISITIFTSICVGIIGIPIITFGLISASLLFGIMGEACFNIINKCSNIFERFNNHHNISEILSRYCKKAFIGLSIGIIILFVSFGVGTLFKKENNI